jgi:hypothetical protein
MYDLQAIAFAADITRVFSFKLGRDGSARVYPESGAPLPFHPASHHGENEARVLQFAQINKYHVGLVPYFLEKLKNIQEGDGNLLEKTLVVYGSPMGNSNTHNHKRCPLFLAGHANGMLKGNLHVKAPTGRRWRTRCSPCCTASVQRHASFGDSTGGLELNAVSDYRGVASTETGRRPGTKATKITKSTKVFVIFVILVGFVMTRGA